MMKEHQPLKSELIMQNSISKADLAQKIDHTLLKPTLNQAELETLCQEASTHQFKTVCIPPTWVKTAVQIFQRIGDSKTLVITVIGFPLGYSTTESKVLEAKTAIADGAKEIDMVINVSFLKAGKLSEVKNDISQIVKACGSTPLKVIIETAYLTDAEKVTAAKLAEDAGAAFVKTSTGFATGVTQVGATLEDIQLLRQTLKPTTQIKASGGIRDFAMAVEMIRAGADRLGTSSGVGILNGLENKGGY